MNFGPFTYFVTTLIFSGIAILLEWTFGFRTLKRYVKVISAVAITVAIFALIGDPVALRLRAWAYNPERTFGTFLNGSAFETVIYAIPVSVAVASATLVWSDWEDNGLPLITTTFSKSYRKLRGLLASFRKRGS
jgi:lycopene cyclase domain-containing protein